VLLVIDNYDSFTFNLVQYFGQLGVSMRIFRNDEITPAEAVKLNPDRVLISPGPCTPERAGISLEAVRYFAGRRPLLGVCLGHQCIAQALGGRVVRAGKVMHGKTSPVTHDGQALFAGIPSPLRVTRYHSLIVEEDSLPANLQITARSDDGVIMALTHRDLPIAGVQFHPEAVLTEHGHRLLKNFLDGSVWQRST